MTRFKGNALMRLRVMNVWLKMPCTKGVRYIFMKGMNKSTCILGSIGVKKVCLSSLDGLSLKQGLLMAWILVIIAL